jgi:hypothetical protein
MEMSPHSIPARVNHVRVTLISQSSLFTLANGHRGAPISRGQAGYLLVSNEGAPVGARE